MLTPAGLVKASHLIGTLANQPRQDLSNLRISLFSGMIPIPNATLSTVLYSAESCCTEQVVMDSTVSRPSSKSSVERSPSRENCMLLLLVLLLVMSLALCLF